MKRLGFIDEKEKWNNLNRASLVVHPSAHEGAAIPILEAWDAGTVVVVSDVPIMKEIGLDGVCYFKMGDVEDLSNKIKNLINNETEMEKLIARGRKNLEKYSWKKTATIILNNILPR